MVSTKPIVSALLVSLMMLISGASAMPPYESRIVAGTNTTEHYPFMVSIRITLNNHFCQGSILTSRTILTAASCMSWIPINRIEAVVGTNLLNQGGIRYRASEMILHPSYDPVTLANDIGLFITNRTIDWSPVVAPTSFATRPILDKITARFYAWGRTSDDHNLHNNLLYVDLNTITNAECQGMFGNITAVASSQLCTFNRIGQGPCTRDYGAPLVYNGTVIGIYSIGITVNETGCAVGYPDLFTRVSSFAGWIEDNIVSEM